MENSSATFLRDTTPKPCTPVSSASPPISLTGCAARSPGDQGREMAKWSQLQADAVDAHIDVFFCDPHSP